MLLPSTSSLTGLALLAHSAFTSASVLPERRSNTYLNNAHAAIAKMQTFYNNPSPGFWTSGWWNSALCLTLLADLRAYDKSGFITGITDGPNGVFLHTLNSQHRDNNGALGYDNFYDDELWWVVALIKTYDATGNRQFLNAADASFQSVVANDGQSPCGGIYNANANQHDDRVASSTIATTLYVEAAAMLANRMPAKKTQYTNLALKQWQWVSNHLLIDSIIQGDSLVGSACTNYKAQLTYYEGVAMSGLVALYHATGKASYLTTAENMAVMVMSGKYPDLVINGIVTEYCDGNLSCNQDTAQFKGVMMRGLKTVHDANPKAAGGKIPSFLQKNADSIWAHSRGGGNMLGLRWKGPYNQGSDANLQLAAHSSATMALVMAAIV